MKDENHRTTERILDVLEVLEQNNKEGLSFSDISRELKIPKGSLHPLLSTLSNRKYIVFNTYNQKYYIGESLFALGRCYVNDSNILNEIDEIMELLSQEVHVTCFLGVLSGNEVFYLLKKNAPGSLQVTAVPGYRLPAYCTGLGKAIIADKEIDELKEMYPEGLKPITEHTIVDFDALYDQLQNIRRTGFSYEREESSVHIQCVAKAIKTNNQTVAAISVAFPVFMDSETEVNQIKKSLQKYGIQIEEIINKNASKWIYSDIFSSR